MDRSVSTYHLGLPGRLNVKLTITRHGESPNARYSCQFHPDLTTWGDREEEAIANTGKALIATIGAVSTPGGMTEEALAELKRDAQWGATDPRSLGEVEA